MKKIIVIAIILAAVICFWEGKREEADMDAEWNLLLVNDDYYVPENYEVDLWELQNGECVDARIYPYLQEMFDAAEEDKIYMVVADGYRSIEEQQQIMDEKIAEYKEQVLLEVLAKKKAEKWVAIPGTSEHQLGLAVDINADVSVSSSEEVYGWLEDNSYKYGFIQRYPSDKVDITGISHEPWHYRYVGKDAAKEIFEQGVCLEEYVGDLENSR